MTSLPFLGIFAGRHWRGKMMRHSTKKIKDGISYTVSLTFSAACWALTLFVFWGLALNVREGVPLISMWHLCLLFLFSLLGAIFRDSWVFDTQNQIIRSFYGFGPFGKHEAIPFDEVSHLALEHFVRGSVDKDAKPTKRRFKAMMVFSLCLKDESSRDIEIIAEKSSGGRTEAAVQAIAAVTGLSLSIDRPRDMDLDVGLRDPD